MDTKKFIAMKRKIAELEKKESIQFIFTYTNIPNHGDVLVIHNGREYLNPDEALLQQLYEGTIKTIELYND